jgi:hypothetical protein
MMLGFLAMLLQVEIKTTPKTTGTDVLQKAADFVHAFLLGEERGPGASWVGMWPSGSESYVHWPATQLSKDTARPLAP